MARYGQRGLVSGARPWRAGAAAGPVADWYRLTAGEWAVLLADDMTVARYHAKVYRRAAGLCWPWLGAISDTGHPKLRAGTCGPGGPRSRVVSALAFGWQLSRGPFQVVDGRLPVIRHRCDFAACVNPSHWLAGTVRQNARDYRQRSADPASPLNDIRGPAGRGRAIRAAILAARRASAGPAEVERVILAASGRGIRGTQEALF